MMTVAAFILLIGRPSFTNASKPRFGDPMMALQFARDVQDIDWILGDAPSPDREVMRVKQYADFGFIACYTALFLALGTLVSRKGGWRQISGIVAGICGLATGIFDVLENRAILNLLDVPLRATTPAMIQAIRGPSTAKWALAGVTVVLLSRIPNSNSQDIMNPLTEIQFKVPFDKVQAAHVEPAVDELLADANKRVEAAVTDPNPLKAIDIMTERLAYAMSVVQHIESVATTPAFRAAFNAVQPKASAFYSSIPLNEGLWKALKSYAASKDGSSLQGTYRRFLTKTMVSFKRHGADLYPAGKKRLSEIDVALTEATTKFSETVLAATNAWEMVVTDEAQLKGLPPSAIAMARASAESKGSEGWRFTLQGPSYVAVMTYLDDARLREQVWRAYNTRAASGTHDNRALLVKILELQQEEKAKLLGFRGLLRSRPGRSHGPHRPRNAQAELP